MVSFIKLRNILSNLRLISFYDNLNMPCLHLNTINKYRLHFMYTQKEYFLLDFNAEITIGFHS